MTERVSTASFRGPRRARRVSVTSGDGLITVASEPERQASVERYGLSGRDAWLEPDPRLVQLADQARRLLDTDYCVVNILDNRRQWTVSGRSTRVALSPRSISICQQLLETISTDGIIEITDAAERHELADSPWINGDAGAVRFYAAMPLIGREGYPLGTICAWSERPGELSDDQRLALGIIRDAVMRHLDARRDALENGADVPAGGRTEWTLDAVIEQRTITTDFQPVVHLATGEIVGFEALSRGPAGTEFEPPQAMLEAAVAQDLVAELDWTMRTAALEAAGAAALPAEIAWLINVEAAGLIRCCSREVAERLDTVGAGLRVVLEVVERGVGGNVLDLLHGVESARGTSCGIALDDVGVERSSLAVLPLVRPDIVKLDMSLLRGVPGRNAAMVTSAVRAFAERSGAVILAEGVETAEQEQLAKVFGATYAQGYRYGRPGPLPDHVPTPVHPLPFAGRAARRDGATPFGVLARHHRPDIALESQLTHVSRYLEDQSECDLDASALMAAYHGHKYFVVVADQVELDEGVRFQTLSSDPDGGPLGDEWLVLVAKPHFVAALGARRRPDGRYEYVYTHDIDAVADAALAFVAAMISENR